MQCSLILSILAAALIVLPSCSIPAERTAYYIATPVGVHGRTCESVARVVQAYALSAGYIPLQPAPGVPERVATYVQPGVRPHRSIFVSCRHEVTEIEAAYDGDTDSFGTRVERKRIFQYLQSHGFTSSSLQQRRYRGMIDVVPFAP